MATLFEEADSEDEITLKTENEYAKKYDTWREKEEIYKLEQKYGENGSKAELESSSDSEDDSSDELEVSEKMETDFLKTLSLLKKRDPRIYDPQYKFFEKQQVTKENEKSEIEAEVKPKKEMSSLALAFGASDDESDDGEIFKVEKAEVQEEKEDKLKEYLTGKTEHLGDDVEQDLAPLKALWSDPKLNDGEAFLRDYILNKRYMEPDAAAGTLDEEALEADEATVEEQGKFERAYNFRFEEPDHEFLKRYPRTVNATRPKDDRRARKRAETRERKDAERSRKMEEIARLKALKLKEIRDKLARIKEVTGNQELAFKDEDIEGDFDPADHDRRMKAIFDEQYYGDADTEKPVFPDLDEELEIENWDKFEDELGAVNFGATSQEADAPHCEDDDFNMDADYNAARARTTLMEEIKETLGKKRRNRKRKSKLALVLATEKPTFNPTLADKTYSEYMDEYYKMDCEDVIAGDLPTRFKYRDVVPNSYGLTVEEILLADDKDLNKWVPLKKAVKYRPEHVEKGEVKTYQQKALDVELKKKILPSLFKDIQEEPELIIRELSKKKKKKKKDNITTNDTIENDKLTEESTNAPDSISVTESNLVLEIEKTKKKLKKHNDIPIVKNDDHVNDASEIEAGTVTAEPSILSKPTDRADASETKNVSVKKKKKNKILNDADTKTLASKENETILKQEDKPSGWIVSDIMVNEDSSVNQVKENGTDNLKKKKKKTKADHEMNNKPNPNKINNMKRKHQSETSEVGLTAKRKKGKDKKKFQQKSTGDVAENPLSRISDERLKAYGLNPKKYRSFLKYKKF